MAAAAGNNNTIQRYSRGNRVEVAIPDPGFEASFYSALIIHRIPISDQVMVQFRTLLEEPETGAPPKALCMVVPVRSVRPMPLEVVVSDFAIGDVVDAQERDGWWTGKVHRKTGVAMFEVFFPTTGELLEYPFADLRVHQRYNHLRQEWTFKKVASPNLADVQMEEVAVPLI